LQHLKKRTDPGLQELGNNVAEMLAKEEVLQGNMHLCGISMGGIVAHLAAREMEKTLQPVASLILIASPNKGTPRVNGLAKRLKKQAFDISNESLVLAELQNYNTSSKNTLKEKTTNIFGYKDDVVPPDSSRSILAKKTLKIFMDGTFKEESPAVFKNGSFYHEDKPLNEKTWTDGRQTDDHMKILDTGSRVIADIIWESCKKTDERSSNEISSLPSRSEANMHDVEKSSEVLNIDNLYKNFKLEGTVKGVNPYPKTTAESRVFHQEGTWIPGQGVILERVFKGDPVPAGEKRKALVLQGGFASTRNPYIGGSGDEKPFNSGNFIQGFLQSIHQKGKRKPDIYYLRPPHYKGWIAPPFKTLVPLLRQALENFSQEEDQSRQEGLLHKAQITYFNCSMGSPVLEAAVLGSDMLSRKENTERIMHASGTFAGADILKERFPRLMKFLGWKKQIHHLTSDEMRNINELQNFIENNDCPHIERITLSSDEDTFVSRYSAHKVPRSFKYGYGMKTNLPKDPIDGTHRSMLDDPRTGRFAAECFLGERPLLLSEKTPKFTTDPNIDLGLGLQPEIKNLLPQEDTSRTNDPRPRSSRNNNGKHPASPTSQAHQHGRGG
jgi:thioesterase domain-containing protein